MKNGWTRVWIYNANWIIILLVFHFLLFILVVKTFILGVAWSIMIVNAAVEKGSINVVLMVSICGLSIFRTIVVGGIDNRLDRVAKLCWLGKFRCYFCIVHEIRRWFRWKEVWVTTSTKTRKQTVLYLQLSVDLLGFCTSESFHERFFEVIAEESIQNWIHRWVGVTETTNKNENCYFQLRLALIWGWINQCHLTNLRDKKRQN